MLPLTLRNLPMGMESVAVLRRTVYCKARSCIHRLHRGTSGFIMVHCQQRYAERELERKDIKFKLTRHAQSEEDSRFFK